MPTKSQFHLFRSRNFAPLFFTQFLGGFNDNFFKSAMVILITYRLAEKAGVDARILVTAAAGVFILPFVLCSSLAGQMADKYERAALARATKIAEIVVMGGAVIGFHLGNITLLMIILFLMGAQSAFFSPVKYSILPQHLPQEDLIGANALIEMGTFLSILSGTIFGGLFVLHESGLFLVSLLVIAIAVLGYVTSRYIPPTVPIDPNLRFRFGLITETASLVRDVAQVRELFIPVLGISWFWLVGATFLAQFPVFAKDVIGANEQVATLFLATFSIGVGLGSLACNSLLKGKISGRYTSLSAYGISLACLLVFLFSRNITPEASFIGIKEYLSSLQHIAILICLVAISFCGGVYIVPLYAILQVKSGKERLARVTACVNVMDSFCMVLSSVGSALLLTFGVDIPGIFLCLALMTAPFAYILSRQIRD